MGERIYLNDEAREHAVLTNIEFQAFCELEFYGDTDKVDSEHKKTLEAITSPTMVLRVANALELPQEEVSSLYDSQMRQLWERESNVK